MEYNQISYIVNNSHTLYFFIRGDCYTCLSFHKAYPKIIELLQSKCLPLANSHFAITMLSNDELQVLINGSNKCY